MKENMSKVDELRKALKTKKEAQKKGHPPAPDFSAEEITQPVSETTESSSEAEKLLENLRTAEEDAKEHYDKLLRVMAEFENFKKRVSREQEERVKYANERLILELLPALDDLERMIGHVSEDAPPEVKAIADGANLVKKTLYNALQKFDLTEVPSLNEPFNPVLHEAVSYIESGEHAPDSVMSVHRKGYKLGERVIRAAQVIVAKNEKSEA